MPAACTCVFACLGVRMQPVDADTQKAMMAWYYKKQEQEKVRAVCCLANHINVPHAQELTPGICKAVLPGFHAPSHA